MVQRVGGNRRKTRSKFKKDIREKGKISITKYFQNFENGQKVVLKANTAVQKGLYHRRFHGLCGTVTGKKGNCYTLLVKDMGKEKSLIVHPIHLTRA